MHRRYSSSSNHSDNEPSSFISQPGLSKFGKLSFNFASLADVQSRYSGSLRANCIYVKQEIKLPRKHLPVPIPSTSRSPLSMMNITNARSTVPLVNPALTAQRFFKVPITNETDIYKTNISIDSPASNGQRGVWYSHFDGQYICRQIIQYPSSDPILLIAGKDDVHMCDRPLDQTDLTRRKGAEIPPGEFENVWAHFGGKPLPKWTP